MVYKNPRHTHTPIIMPTSSSINIRVELIGHSTLAVLAVLGLALYSTTYSLVYATNSSRTSPIVAVLEMWMVSTHLASPMICGIVQALFAAELRFPLIHIAEAQSSLFLGMACIVTILGFNCINENGGPPQYYCSAYYGAAAIPRFAAAGSIAWAWVMYVSSLGCQTMGISLGISGKSALTVSSTILLLPYMVASKLGSTCGGQTWTMPLCNNACGIAGPVTVVSLSLMFSHGGAWLMAINQKSIGVILMIIGPLIMSIGSFSLWASQNGNSQSGSQHIIPALLSTLSFMSALRQIPPSTKNGKKKKPKTSALFSLFSVKSPLLSKQKKTASSQAATRAMFPTNSYHKQ
jgi:hypothetical protein